MLYVYNGPFGMFTVVECRDCYSIISHHGMHHNCPEVPQELTEAERQEIQVLQAKILQSILVAEIEEEHDVDEGFEEE